ncbi:MAG: NAD(P)-dependent oxidoreductase [Alphaproteobacteria bacterium]|nr:NAD(P)-dependent oxidoreductase [Alphaproteobacteria bacterium]
MAKVLILGGTGKLGAAFTRVLGERHCVTSVGSAHLNAADFAAVETLVNSDRFDVVINAVACLGIDGCERNAVEAFHLNVSLPKRLARWAQGHGFTLVHISSDAVFSGDKGGDYYFEDDAASPVNIYGLTKYGGDVSVMEECDKYYIVRVGVLFGHTNKSNQIFERMVDLSRGGQNNFKLSTDIVTSPTYSIDVAREVASWLELERPFGLYHVVNHGKGSICDFISYGLGALGFKPTIEPVSHREFPAIGRKNTYTPMASRTVRLRPWQDALDEYCQSLCA